MRRMSVTDGPGADSEVPRGRLLALRAGQLTAVLVAAVILLAIFGPGGTTTAYVASGAPVPLPDDQLAPVDVDDFGGILVGLRGTPVVVNLWASWCAPCRTEMPLLQRAASDYDDRIVLLGLASRDSPRAAAAFLEEVGVDYPSVFDASGDIRRQLGSRGFPTTYFFDENGRLVDAVVGGLSEQQLVARIDDLLR